MGELTLAVEKRLAALSAEDEARLLGRGRAVDPEVERAVAGIVADVRERGDASLRDQAQRFDGVELEALEVPGAACEAALEALDADVRGALEQAAASIAAFHRAQLPPPLEVEVRPGVRLGRRAEPLRRVGVYAPGGRASYPSSVLMGVVPARVAGVDEVVVCSPPGPDGRPPGAVLAACALAGADRVFALGGAGAVAALAYGTASVPLADKVVGPGNAYVNEAKRQLTGAVAVDTPAGPSEVLLVADDGADAELAALELLAQAEHDPDAAAVLVATDERIARAVRRALDRRLPDAPRRDVIEAALADAGALLTAGDLDEALAFAERYAPEHLLLLVREPRRALDRVRAAGTVFLGPSSSVAFGDYVTGANHVLPTGGLARAHSGLSTADFLREFTYQEVADDAAGTLAGPTAALADAEGLPAHAAAARARIDPAAPGTPEGEGDERSRPERASTKRVETPQRRSREEAPRSGSAAREGETAAPAPPANATPRRATYRHVDRYDPGRRPVAVDLSDNTNRFGTAPAALRTLRSLNTDTLTRYPSVYGDRLKATLAERLDVAPENIATGCGSDGVIDSAVRAFCEPGDVFAYPEPTFSMAEAFARMNGARPAPLPLDDAVTLDVDALLAARGRVTYLCRPNNPTGALVDRGAVERLDAESGGLVLLDEAYAEFADGGLTAAAAQSTRTVAVRTFSKAYGLAGLRVGYAVGPADVIAEIEKSRGPYKLGAAAEAAAVAALVEDGAWIAETVDRTRENRGRLADALEARGLRTWPSAANFLLVRCPEGIGGTTAAAGPSRDAAGAAGKAPTRPDRDGHRAHAAGAARSAGATDSDAAAGPDGGASRMFVRGLRERGIGVRGFRALPGAGDCIRVSIGPWPLMERFLAAVDELLDGRDS